MFYWEGKTLCAVHRGCPASVLDSPAFSCQPPRSFVAHHAMPSREAGSSLHFVFLSHCLHAKKKIREDNDSYSLGRFIWLSFFLLTSFSKKRENVLLIVFFFCCVHSVLSAITTSQVFCSCWHIFIPLLNMITLFGIPSVLLSLVLSYLPQFAAVVMKDLTCTEQNNPNKKWSLAKNPPKPPESMLLCWGLDFDLPVLIFFSFPFVPFICLPVDQRKPRHLCLSFVFWLFS